MTPKSNIFKNWQVVLLSLLGATTFWFFSALGKTYSTRIEQPIDFEFDRDSLIAVKKLPAFVELEVTGNGWDLFRQGFWFGKETINIPLLDPVNTKFLTREDFRLHITKSINPFQLNYFITDSLLIDIDVRSSKEVILFIDTLNVDLEQGYRLISDISILPDTAIIFGPKKFLDTLEVFYEVPINERAIDQNFSEFLQLALPKKFDIRSEPNTIQVAFDVDLFERKIYHTVLDPLNFPKDSSILPQNIEVEVSYTIQESLQDDFNEEAFKIIADYDMLNPADSMIPTMLVLNPKEAIEVEVSPDSVLVIYTTNE